MVMRTKVLRLPRPPEMSACSLPALMRFLTVVADTPRMSAASFTVTQRVIGSATGLMLRLAALRALATLRLWRRVPALNSLVITRHHLSAKPAAR